MSFSIQSVIQCLLVSSIMPFFTYGRVDRRDGPPDPGDATIPDPGLPPIPWTAKPPNTFNNTAPERIMDDPYSSDPIPSYYQPRDIDLPFGRMVHGKMAMFPQGQVNDPALNTNHWAPGVWDFANQSACGIPDNSLDQNKAAIHPYWLQYAGLDRYCLQDVCISMWSEINTPDMIVKVTDICSTDPNDPTHCADPTYIKVDRAKVQVLYQIPGAGADNHDLQLPVYPRGVFWHFTKCWLMALPQPAYVDNWWAQPVLPNNFNWDVDATQAQMRNNQQTYGKHNWTLYPDGTEIPTSASEAAIVEITDWVPGQEPAWAPIAGGKGYGTPERSCGKPPVLYPGQSTERAQRSGLCNGTLSHNDTASSGGPSPSGGAPSSVELVSPSGSTPSGAQASTSQLSGVLPSGTCKKRRKHRRSKSK